MCLQGTSSVACSADSGDITQCCIARSAGVACVGSLRPEHKHLYVTDEQRCLRPHQRRQHLTQQVHVLVVPAQVTHSQQHNCNHNGCSRHTRDNHARKAAGFQR